MTAGLNRLAPLNGGAFKVFTLMRIKPMTSQTAHRGKRSVIGKAGIVVALTAMVGLSACQSMQDNPKQGLGTVLGGVGGAVLGAQFGQGTGQLAATAVGTLLGAYAGSEVGASLDKADHLQAQQAQQAAMAAPIGRTVNWNNPNSGHSGTITPVNDGRSSAGEYCREYKTTVTVDGREEQAYGQACRQSDGTWQIIQ
jgi:surface antigen